MDLVRFSSNHIIFAGLTLDIYLRFASPRAAEHFLLRLYHLYHLIFVLVFMRLAGYWSLSFPPRISCFLNVKTHSRTSLLHRERRKVQG